MADSEKPFLRQVVFGGLNIIFKKRKVFFQRLLDLQEEILPTQLTRMYVAEKPIMLKR